MDRSFGRASIPTPKGMGTAKSKAPSDDAALAGLRAYLHNEVLSSGSTCDRVHTRLQPQGLASGALNVRLDVAQFVNLQTRMPLVPPVATDTKSTAVLAGAGWVATRP